MCVRSRSERRFILEHIELLMKKSILSGEKFQISARNTEKLPLLGLNNLTTTLFFATRLSRRISRRSGFECHTIKLNSSPQRLGLTFLSVNLTRSTSSNLRLHFGTRKMLVQPFLRSVLKPVGFASRTPAAAVRRYTAGKLRINADRMMKTLHDTCEWGAAHRYGAGPFETGMARLTLNEDDATARRWLADEAQKLGCSVTVDEMGNMFMVRQGHKSGPPTAMGSHLDTQPTGGRYDGILGIMAGLEALRTMNDHNVTTEYPVALINWTNEEGARFRSRSSVRVYGVAMYR